VNKLHSGEDHSTQRLRCLLRTVDDVAVLLLLSTTSELPHCWCCCAVTNVEVVTVVAVMLLLHVLTGVTNVEDDNNTQRMLQMECLLRDKEAVYIGESTCQNTYNFSCTQNG